MKNISKATLGRLAILVSTLCWGTSFVILKNTLNYISTFYVLAIRFILAAVIMMVIARRELKKIDRGYIKSGVIMGLCLFLAYIFQTYGLIGTTPGKNAFLTSTYCVITPFLYWITFRKRPDRYNVIAALFCVAGMGFISLTGDLRISLGDALSMICGIFFAAHIIATDKGVADRSVAIMTMLQFAVAGILSLIAAFIFDPIPTDVPVQSWLSILYLCCICTALCFFMQSFGQKNTPASQSAVLLALESVFGAAISLLLGQETMTVRLGIGFALTFIAVIISETKLGFLHRKKSE